MNIERWSGGKPTPGLTSRIVRLAVGLSVIAFGVWAMRSTARFVPWHFWSMIWPVMILLAGALLLFYGGRPTLVAGLILIVIGGFFMLGVVGSLTWVVMGLIWPIIVIMVGVAIVGAALRRSAGSP